MALLATLRRRKAEERSTRLLALTGGGLVLALLMVAASHIPRLTTLTFQGSEMRISILASETVYSLASQNKVKSGRGVIELWTPKGAVTLPVKGEWVAGDLLVDAAYLANEFNGRSSRTRQAGGTLSESRNIQPEDADYQHHDQGESDHRNALLNLERQPTASP